MKTIYEYIVNNHVSNTKINNDNVIQVNKSFNEFADECANNNVKLDKNAISNIKRFLKGTEYRKALSLQFNDYFLHVSRYSDMHNMRLSFLLTSNYEFPKDWNHAYVKHYIDDRAAQNDLYDLFINTIGHISDTLIMNLNK